MNSDSNGEFQEYLGFDDWDETDLESFAPTSDLSNDSYYREHGFRKNNRPYRVQDIRYRLKHIIDAYHTLQNQVAYGREQFLSNDDRGDEIRKISERCIEIIAEASAAIHSNYKEFFDVPWRDLYAMRNIISHSYHEVDNDIVWEAMTIDIPEFIANLGLSDANKSNTIYIPDELK